MKRALSLLFSPRESDEELRLLSATEPQPAPIPGEPEYFLQLMQYLQENLREGASEQLARKGANHE